MFFLVNSHTNATRIGWHLWESDLRFAPGLPPGWASVAFFDPGIVVRCCLTPRCAWAASAGLLRVFSATGNGTAGGAALPRDAPRGPEPESYITEYTLVYEDKLAFEIAPRRPRVDTEGV